MRMFLVILLLCGATLSGQEYGDAPASYGTLYAWGAGQTCWLGSTVTSDTTNPVSPAWTGDSDDGLLGNPQWSSWSSENSFSVYVDAPINQSGPGGTHVPTMVYLVAFVDANDDGQFTSDETYLYSPHRVPSNAPYTIGGIRIHATQNFVRNGQNKVAVRIAVQATIGAPPALNPNGSFFMGEVEDWLIDVSPAVLVVGTETLPLANEGNVYSHAITAANGTPPYQWSLVAGTLPAGLTLAQSGADFLLSGTPSSGTGLANYSITVRVTDAALVTSSRALVLRVDPAPYALPFVDDFSADRGWNCQHLWARAVVSGTPGTAVKSNLHGQFPTEPAQDFTPGSTDNMALMDSPGAPYQQGLPSECWATSPRLDCSQQNSVQLRFRRWLSHSNAESGIRIQARGNGNWVTVWDRVGAGNLAYPTSVDAGWTLERIDMSAVVAGCAQAQVRFGIGPESFGAMDDYGYMGWCIDDVEVVRTPIGAPTMALMPSISSPAVFTGTGWAGPLPVVYPGNVHGFSVDIENTGGPAMTIHSVEIGMINDVYVPAVGVLPLHYEANNGWHGNVTASLTAPTGISAGTASAAVSGSFVYSGAPLNFAFIELTAHFFLRGIATATGEAVELYTTARITPSPTALPGLRVHEESVSTGPQISNGAAAAGLRAFGSVAAGSNSSWVNIVLKNTSSTPLNLGAPALAGADPSQFQLFTGSMIFSLTSGQTTWFSVRFSPTGIGARQATVAFAHDAANTGTPFEFDVSGLGIGNGPVLAVYEGSASGSVIANGSAAAGGRDFGQVVMGTQSALTVYVENTGNQNLTLGSVTLTGTGAASFGLSGALPTVLAPGTSATFQIDFSPTTAGTFNATVEFTHDDIGQATPFSFAVVGQGIGNTPLVLVNEGFIGGAVVHYGAGAAGGRLFGQRDVGTGPSVETIFLIGNTGWQPLSLGMPVITGAHSTCFVVDAGRMVLTLQPGEWTGFTVAFEPVAKGLKVAQVEFAHNDPTLSQPFSFEVRGVGVDVNGVTISYATLPLGREGIAYGPHQVGATGGTQPYAWTIVAGSLPAGMSFSAGGEFSGTPLAYGIFGLQLQVIDALGGDDVRYMELAIQPPPGHVEKGGNGGEGGCAACGAGGMPILLALLAFRRRRRSASRRG